MPETLFDSLPVYLATCLIMVIAQAVYVLFGFGAGLIAVGTLALIFPQIQDVVVMLLLVNLPAELYVVITSRRHILWRSVLKIFAGIAAGIPLGTVILKYGEPTFILVLLGVFLIAVGSAFLFVPQQRAKPWPTWSEPGLGLISGMLTGLFGTGGPPLIIYYQLKGKTKAAFRGHLMAIFFLMTFVRLPSYAVGGLITLPRIWSSLALLPAVVLGAWLGNRIHLSLTEDTFRRLVSIVLMLIGMVLLLRRFIS